jgi:hypothetical protein
VTKRVPKASSKPKFFNRFDGTRFPTTPDSWQTRLRIALRMGNGAVLTARQCGELAVALGWPERGKA